MSRENVPAEPPVRSSPLNPKSGSNRNMPCTKLSSDFEPSRSGCLPTGFAFRSPCRMIRRCCHANRLAIRPKQDALQKPQRRCDAPLCSTHLRPRQLFESVTEAADRGVDLAGLPRLASATGGKVINSTAPATWPTKKAAPPVREDSLVYFVGEFQPDYRAVAVAGGQLAAAAPFVD